MFASTGTKPDRDGTKDSVSNIRETGVFAVNIVEYAMKDVMNATSGPWDRKVDEFDFAEIDRLDCETIPCSRVAGTPAALECKLTQIVELKGDANYMVLGEVTGVHIRDNCVVDGIFDILTYQPLTRLGYRDYSRITEVFSLARPGE